MCAHVTHAQQNSVHQVTKTETWGFAKQHDNNSSQIGSTVSPNQARMTRQLAPVCCTTYNAAYADGRRQSCTQQSHIKVVTQVSSTAARAVLQQHIMPNTKPQAVQPAVYGLVYDPASAYTAQILHNSCKQDRMPAEVGKRLRQCDERLTEQFCSTTKVASGLTPPQPLQQSVFQMTLTAQTPTLSPSARHLTFTTPHSPYLNPAEGFSLQGIRQDTPRHETRR
jgi:hypothetical protein